MIVPAVPRHGAGASPSTPLEPTPARRGRGATLRSSPSRLQARPWARPSASTTPWRPLGVPSSHPVRSGRVRTASCVPCPCKGASRGRGPGPGPKDKSCRAKPRPRQRPRDSPPASRRRGRGAHRRPGGGRAACASRISVRVSYTREGASTPHRKSMWLKRVILTRKWPMRLGSWL